MFCIALDFKALGRPLTPYSKLLNDATFIGCKPVKELVCGIILTDFYRLDGIRSLLPKSPCVNCLQCLKN